jgi:[acyl-carrier-protein] S-malonyltransferase
MKKYGIVFPGQGSQKVGMGADLFDHSESAREKVNYCNSILKTSINKICISGPQDVLTETKHAQPALFLVSALLFDLLIQHHITPTVIAGHSLGELTAYYASRSLSFEDALNLITVRGESMSRATTPHTSGMAAVLGMPIEEIQKHITDYKRSPVCIANINCPGQVVISGEKKGLNQSIDVLKSNGAKIIPLQVSGAFHSPLMKSAQSALEQAVSSITFNDAQYPIILNQSGEPETRSQHLKTNIPKQVISSVQWIKTIEEMTSKCDTIIECGTGKVLSGLIRKISPQTTTISISNFETAIQFINTHQKEASCQSL